MNQIANRNKPYFLLMDTENLSIDDILKTEDQLRVRRLYVAEKLAFERENHPTSGKKRKILESEGYKFVNIGNTTEKNAVDNAIKEEAWKSFYRHRKHLILATCDGGFSETIGDLTRQGVRIFLPKLKQASSKLKSIRSVTETYDDAIWRTKSSQRLVCALEDLKSSIGCITSEIKNSHHLPEQQAKFEGLVEVMQSNPVLCVNGWLYPDRLSTLVDKQWVHAIKVHLKTRSDFIMHESGDKDNLIVAHKDAVSAEPLDPAIQRLKIAKRIAEMYDGRLPRPSKTNKLIRQALSEISIADANTRMFVDMFEKDSGAANIIGTVISFDESNDTLVFYSHIRSALADKFARAEAYAKKRGEGKAVSKKAKRPLVAVEIKNLCENFGKGSTKHLTTLVLHSDLERMYQLIEDRFFEEYPQYRAGEPATVSEAA